MNFGYLSWNINHSGDLNFSFRAQTYIELVSRRFFRIQRSGRLQSYCPWSVVSQQLLDIHIYDKW
jgi:hypothetical protein